MMKEMYKGIVNSPITSLSEDIGAKDTDIKVGENVLFLRYSATICYVLPHQK